MNEPGTPNIEYFPGHVGGVKFAIDMFLLSNQKELWIHCASPEGALALMEELPSMEVSHPITGFVQEMVDRNRDIQRFAVIIKRDLSGN